jgi:hypothetical protein
VGKVLLQHGAYEPERQGSVASGHGLLDGHSAAKVEHCACQRGDAHAVNRRHVPFSEWRRMHMYDGTPIAAAVPIPCDMHTINCCRPDGQPVQYGG